MMGRIAVCGLGKLGSVMAALLARSGHTVTGLDRDPRTLRAIADHRAPVKEPGLDDLMAALPDGALSATNDVAFAVDSTDAAIIVVPTPSLSSGAFDSSAVVDVVTGIGAALSTSKPPRDAPYLVVVASTLSPRSMELDVVPALEKASGMTVGTDLLVAYSPEFIALGSVIADMTDPDMVLLGTADRRSAEVAAALSASFRGPTPTRCMSFTEAEVTKLAINAYLSVKIGFANMIGEAVAALDGNASVVLEAVGSDGRIGGKFLKAGGPPTGPCLPRDVVALRRLGVELSVPMPLADAAQEAATNVIDRVMAEAGPLRKVTILGVAYKPQSPVTDASLGLGLIPRYVMRGVEVATFDPHATVGPDFPFQHRACETAEEAIDFGEAVIVACPHAAFDKLDFGKKRVVNPWQT